MGSPDVTPYSPEYKKNHTARTIRIGFVPLNDCAPLVAAAEMGFFERHGLNVRLSKELGWATIRDKLVHGDLDAAHAPCALPFALRAATPHAEFVTGIVINLNGNAITLSESLWKQGVHDAQGLKQYLRVHRGQKVLTFGIVSRYSSHGYLLSRWLESGGIDVAKEVRLVVVPPPQMASNLRAGHLDGYCAGEPWNSLAVAEGSGWIAATSDRLAPMHPEKALVARGEFANRRHPEHIALIRALLQACEFCDKPENRDPIISLLARREYANLPAPILSRGWPGPFDRGHGQTAIHRDFLVFSRDGSNEPSTDKAAWVVNHVLDPEFRKSFTPADLSRVFRTDLFAEALTPESGKKDIDRHPKTHESELVAA